MESTRKTFVGTVVSDARDKTIAVAVESYVKHPIYGKRFKKIKKLHTHDELNKAKKGDIVEVIETRPISKSKTFKLVKIVQAARDGE